MPTLVRVDELTELTDSRTDTTAYPHAQAVVDEVLIFESEILRRATAVDNASHAFDAIIAKEEAEGGQAGDHFAAPGANSRVWNALEKLAVRAPEAFVDYYASDMIALASTAWLGPGYQITSQVNVVRPGGKAQEPTVTITWASWPRRWPSAIRRTPTSCRRY